MITDQMPTIVTITDIIVETPHVKTFVFDTSFSNARPGQFCMVWVPGIDEIPMAYSSPNSITVMNVGDATSAMFDLNIGDKLGIRGPYGNGYSPTGKVLAIGGGIGVTPLYYLATNHKIDTFVLGARTVSDLVFSDKLSKLSDLHIATDDGSSGYHGFVTGILDEKVNVIDYDTICVCGPEMMMKGVLDRLISTGIEDRGQFSLHRYMKCGVGVCGSCCIDHEGLRVCTDGPIFTGTVLKSSEFAHYHRGSSGNKE